MAACLTKAPSRLASERGVALAIVLLILVLILLLGSTVIGLSVNEGRSGSIVADGKQAFFAAEAGVQETMYRMRLDPAIYSDEGDTTYSPAADPVVIGFVQGETLTIPNSDPTHANFWKYNPSWTYSGNSAAGYGNYMGATAANLNSAGRTFSSSGGSHAAGSALANANLANGASYTVTVALVVGFVDGCWQYVNQLGVPLASCASVATNPMFKVRSTGTARNAQVVLSTMIHRFKVSAQLDAALTANTNINVQSASAIIDGRDYDCNGNNPSSDGNFKAASTPTGTSGISLNKPQNLQCDDGTGATTCGGTSHTFPNTIGALLLPPSATQFQIDALNAYLESIKIDPVAHPEKLPTSAFHGILYVDGNYAKPPDGSTGMLIVHHRDASNHDVATLGNFNDGTFKGLIIADRIDKINGSAQVIGGIFGFGNASDGVTVDDVTGTPSVKYSKCALDTYLPPSFPFQIVSGTWHEE